MMLRNAFCDCSDLNRVSDVAPRQSFPTPIYR